MTPKLTWKSFNRALEETGAFFEVTTGLQPTLIRYNGWEARNNFWGRVRIFVKIKRNLRSSHV